MYSEVIHTRCGNGIDIKKNQAPINGGGIGGFKVHSCSRNVTDDGFVDLQFLDKVLSEKQSYTDPAFMDDAYLYYVPDIGNRILVNFHPIHFDRTAKPGNYPHRPGNFINQSFIGNFDNIYPYETFGNESVWDAQKRGEAYYYENAPMELPQRNNLADEIGSITLEDISVFIADGRRDALKSAVAFLISQYDLSPDERKFLVIRDENARQIELWIAAIESAFSPRMASGLSFATRLDKFVNTNKYTVNLNGRYQPTINLQSPDQKLRYRAMIVGIDERDKSNISAVRLLPNSPFVILDGKTKTLSTQVDTTNPFYQFVTGFDDAHSYFCREFMQTVDILSPTSAILRLFSAYSILERYGSYPALKDVVSGLNILGRYPLIRTPYLENLYKKLKSNLSDYLKDDAILAFSVLNWLNKTATLVGDLTARESFNRIVCQSFAANIFKQPQSKKTAELIEVVKDSSFIQNASAYLMAESTVAEYEAFVQEYKSAEWTAFSEHFVKSINSSIRNKEKLSNVVRDMLSKSIRTMYDEKNGNGALYIAGLYCNLNRADTVETLLFDAASSGEPSYSHFIISVICRISPEITSTDRNLTTFRERLQNYHMEEYFPVVLAFKAGHLVNPQEMERFMDSILSDKEFKGLDLSPILTEIDKNLNITDKMAGRIAAKIQNLNNGKVICINSAHICALSVIDDKRSSEHATSLINNLISQRFPSVEDEVYASTLMKKLFADKVSEDLFAAVVEASEQSSFYADRIVQEAFLFLGTRQADIIGKVIASASRFGTGNLFNALVKNCAALKQFDKGISAIKSTLRTKNEQQYFSLIEREASIVAEQNKGASLFGKLFSHNSSDNPNSGRWGKK